MDPEAPTGANRRGFRRWTWLIPAVLILPLLVFFLSNLWLATPWSCRWIAAKFERQTGLEAHVGGATWSPWNGASVQSVDLLQPPALRAAIPKPLVHIDSIRLAPVWRAWLRGRLEVNSITLDTPQLTIPIELLSYLSGSQQNPTPPSTAPPAAVAPPPVAQTNSPALANPPVPTPPAAAAAPPPLPPTPAMPPRPTGWLHLKNASLALVSTGKKAPLIEAASINGSLPIGGDPAQSVIHINSINFSGDTIVANLTAPIDWTQPVLSLKPTGLEIKGFKFVVAAKIATLSGLPIQIEAQLPKQVLPETKLPFNGTAQAESIAANAGFRGLLAAPATWQGDLLAETIAPAIHLGGNEAKFDRGSAVTVLRGGLLSCVDARLISDELSFLGNATVLANGRGAAVIRAVAPPANLEAIVKHLFPNIEQPSLTPLNTPQRSAFDLEAFGDVGHPFLRLGKDGPILNLKPAAPSP